MTAFDTYIKRDQIIKPEDNVFQLFVNINGAWVFRGLVSEDAKKSMQSDGMIETMNSRYQDQEILASFSGKPVEQTATTYLFIPCENAEVVVFKPSYKEEVNNS